MLFAAHLKGHDALIKNSVKRFDVPSTFFVLLRKKKHFCALRPEKINKFENLKKKTISTDFNKQSLK